MRITISLLFALIAGPVFAQGWERYENDRFGYVIDIPPGFSEQQASQNGDGKSFALEGKHSFLVVWGGLLMDDFETQVTDSMTWAEEDAWNINYQATTPTWASFSGIKGFRILYQRMVLLCDGSYAAFQAEYSVTATKDMDPVIEKLVRSLRGPAC